MVIVPLAMVTGLNSELSMFSIMYQSFGGIIVSKAIQLVVVFIFSVGLSPLSYAAGLDEIPADIRADLYDPKLTDPAQPVEASIYRDWKSKRPPPWTIGYASTYAGNTWRKGAMQRLLAEVLPKWQKLGLIKDIIVTQSNLRDSLQIQQMRQLVDQGVDAIIICCSNPTALNQTIKYAYDKGVPTFSFTGYVTSPYAMNSSVNYHKAGYEIGRWMAEEINEKGNVLVIVGLSATASGNVA